MTATSLVCHYIFDIMDVARMKAVGVNSVRFMHLLGEAVKEHYNRKF